MSNVVAVAAWRIRVIHPTLPVISILLPNAVAEDDATTKLIPVEPARVAYTEAVEVALRIQNVCLSPAIGTTDETVDDAGNVSVGFVRFGVYETTDDFAHWVKQSCHPS